MSDMTVCAVAWQDRAGCSCGDYSLHHLPALGLTHPSDIMATLHLATICCMQVIKMSMYACMHGGGLAVCCMQIDASMHCTTRLCAAQKALVHFFVVSIRSTEP